MPNPSPELYPDINTVWTAFERGLIGISGMVMYRPAWESYLYRALEEFAKDSVLYLEFRGVLPPVSKSFLSLVISDGRHGLGLCCYMVLVDVNVYGCIV